MMRVGALMVGLVLSGLEIGCNADTTVGHRSMFEHPVCPDGWCWERPAPFGQTVLSPRRFWAAAPDAAWAVTDREIHQWNGERWHRTEGPFVGPIDGLADDNVIVGTETGAMHFDGGEWRVMRDCPKPHAIWVAGANDAWLAAKPEPPSSVDSVTLWRWDGRACSAFQTFDNATYGTLDGSDPSNGWFALNTRRGVTTVITGAVILRWDGATWTQTLETKDASGIEAVSAKQAWLRTDAALWMWDGDTWTKSIDGLVYSTWFASPTNGWATKGRQGEVEEVGDILHWDGSTWAPVHEMGAPRIHLYGVSDRELFAVVEGVAAPATFREQDRARWNGSYWSDDPHWPEKAVLSRVTVGPTGEVWAVSEDVLFRKSGTRWVPVAAGAGIAISSGAAGEVWVLRESGLYRWDGEWHDVAMWGDEPKPAVSIWAVNDNDLFVITSRALHKRGPSGWQWSKDAPEYVGNLRGVHGTGVDDVWVIGTTGVARLVDGAWERVRLADCRIRPSSTWRSSLSDIWVAAPDTAYILGTASYEFSDTSEEYTHLWRVDPGDADTCASTSGSNLPEPRLAACGDEAWIVYGGSVGRFMDGRWTYKYIGATFLDIDCRNELGFWAVGYDGVVVNRPPEMSF